MAGRRKPNELTLTRIFNAPVKMVWEAWTELEHIHQWWGPRGFTLTTKSKDLRPGGQWVYTMHGPDGVDYPNITFYHEVIPGSRLVYDHGATETDPPLFRVTVNFEEVANDKTRMDMTMAFASEEAAQQAKKFIKIAGGNSTWDRLAEYVDKMSLGKDRFVLNRSVEAPPEKVFALWTNPSFLSQWFPPNGFQTKGVEGEIRQGEVFRLKMENAQGQSFMSAHDYKEIRPQEFVSYVVFSCDENGKPMRPSQDSNWPKKILTSVRIVPEDEGETRITLELEPIGSVTREELDTFLAQRAALTQRWNGALDKFEELLQK